jgi:hypothetical protein
MIPSLRIPRNKAEIVPILRSSSQLEAADAQEGPMTTVWIYVDTSKEVGDVDHLKVFATQELADEWFKENDPEGVAFGYEVIEE